MSHPHKSSKPNKPPKDSKACAGKVNSSSAAEGHHWEGKISMRRKIGGGSFGTIYSGEWVRDGMATTSVAIKTFKKKEFIDTSLYMSLKHKNVIKFLEWSERKNGLILIMELAEGGDLYNRLDSDAEFTEVDSAVITHQLLDGLQYIHSKGIIHRDIKPENILFKYDSRNSANASKEILICDFDMAISSKGSPTYAELGTGPYMAPEILQTGSQLSRYSKVVDVWSAGITCFVMLSGDLTFFASKVEIQREKEKVSLQCPNWNEISKGAKSFLFRCLKVDPRQRDPPAKLMLDEWFEVGKVKDQLSGIKNNLVASEAAGKRKRSPGAVNVEHKGTQKK